MTLLTILGFVTTVVVFFALLASLSVRRSDYFLDSRKEWGIFLAQLIGIIFFLGLTVWQPLHWSGLA